MRKNANAAAVLTLACVLLAASALLWGAGPQTLGTFRVVSNLPGYQSPGGLVEGFPGLFFSIAELAGTSSYLAFSATAKGVVTTLHTFPAQYSLSYLATGPNGRVYGAGFSQAGSANVFSVSAKPGVLQYPIQAIGPNLAQGVPGGAMLGIGSNFSTGFWSLTQTDQSGVVSSFYTFAAGDRPEYPPIYASDGNYYGVDYGAANGPYAYRVTPGGVLTSLHLFPRSAFNGITISTLIQASDGNLYGVAPLGGANATGLVYKLSLAGDYSPVYSFPKGPAGFPTWMIQASDGNLYGTTSGNLNDPHGHSVLFRLTTSGQQYTELFAWGASACQCYMIQGSDGKIYGIAQPGQEFFSWNGGLPKPAPQALQFKPTSGAPGTQVLIWGYNLLSPSVTFNGVAAASVIGSGPNYVLATVPSGAATGPITVATPGGNSATPGSFTVE